MSGDGDRKAEAVEALVGDLIDYIETATPEQIEELAGGRARAVAAGREAVSRARRIIAARRREAVSERMAAAKRVPRPDVSHLSLSELEAIFAAHVANDDASATMAARHEKGEMNEAELRSVVADILRLRRPD